VLFVSVGLCVVAVVAQRAVVVAPVLPEEQRGKDGEERTEDGEQREDIHGGTTRLISNLI
jgi:hypothetical protein